jgi:hypothetical protein
VGAEGISQSIARTVADIAATAPAAAEDEPVQPVLDEEEAAAAATADEDNEAASVNAAVYTADDPEAILLAAVDRFA